MGPGVGNQHDGASSQAVRWEKAGSVRLERNGPPFDGGCQVRVLPEVSFAPVCGEGFDMTQGAQNVVSERARHGRSSRETVVWRLLVGSGAALALLGSLAGCARRPAADSLPSGAVICGKMCAAIESVSRGSVRVEEETSDDAKTVPVKSSFRLVFDDTRQMLRYDRQRKSHHTKYARTPTECLFQLVGDVHARAILVSAPDHDLVSAADYAFPQDRPLEPHLLWCVGPGDFLLRKAGYADVKRAWLRHATAAAVSQDSAGRLILRWTQRLAANTGVEIIQTLVVDPTLGFVPVRIELASRLVGSTESAVAALTEIRYGNKDGCSVPISLEMHGNGGRTIKLTCHWESVNQDIDPKAFTVDGFEATKGTPIYDFRGSQPLLLGVTGPAAPRIPEHPPTLDQLIARSTDSEQPLGERLREALRDARLDEKRVLIFASSPTSAICHRFLSIYDYREMNADDAHANQALANYAVSGMDTSLPERSDAIKSFLARWNLTPPAADDATLAILDGEGQLIAATTGKQLWPDKVLGGERLTAFLKEHSPSMPDAEKLLAEALAQAKREDKRVLVELSGPGCGSCIVLARYLDEHKSLMERDYVCLKVDSRFTNGEQTAKTLRPKSGGGIPWMVVLDADAKPLITSDGPDGNIGYPGSEKGIAHFEKMLRTTAQHLHDAEIRILIAALGKKRAQ
jgi:hypothetical protein